MSGARNVTGRLSLPRPTCPRTPDDAAGALVGHGVGDRGVLVQPRARLLGVPDQQLVEVLPGADGAEVRERRERRPLQLQADPAAEDAQAAVVQPAGLLAAVDAEIDDLFDAAGGEPVSADLRAREGGLLQQQHVQPRAGEVGGCGRTCGPGTDDDDVGVGLRSAAGGGIGDHGGLLVGLRGGTRAGRAPCERIHEVGPSVGGTPDSCASATRGRVGAPETCQSSGRQPRRRPMRHGSLPGPGAVRPGGRGAGRRRHPRGSARRRRPSPRTGSGARARPARARRGSTRRDTGTPRGCSTPHGRPPAARASARRRGRRRGRAPRSACRTRRPPAGRRDGSPGPSRPARRPGRRRCAGRTRSSPRRTRRRRRAGRGRRRRPSGRRGPRRHAACRGRSPRPRTRRPSARARPSRPPSPPPGPAPARRGAGRAPRGSAPASAGPARR